MQLLQRLGSTQFVRRICVVTGMDLDSRDAEGAGLIDRLASGVDEQTDANPGVLEAADGGGEPAVAAAEREPALGRDLAPFLRHERRLEGADAPRDPDDVGVRAELEIDDGADAAAQR